MNVSSALNHVDADRQAIESTHDAEATAAELEQQRLKQEQPLKLVQQMKAR